MKLNQISIITRKKEREKSIVTWRFYFVISIMCTILILASGITFGKDLSAMSGERLAQIGEGGMLYDSWFATFDKEDIPVETHSAYPSIGKKKRTTTWRCKECHGWDYKGKDGAYSKGSHYSGISGIRSFDGASEQKVVAILKDKNHLLGSRIDQRGLEALAVFVTNGQIEMDDFIDRKTKKTKGNVVNGGRFFQTICAKCHGSDGKKMNFHTPDDPEFVGTVATENPWEALHKMRMGHPKENMPALLAFPIQTQIDILSYAQTLPPK